MKTIRSLILVAALASTTALSAQTTYNINSNTSYSAAGIPATCKNCIINIAGGVTLTIDKSVNLQNVAFNGGSPKSTIESNSNNITFAAPGSFTNIIANLKNTSFSNSGALTITNSAFTFYNNSTVSINASVSLVSSTWKLYDNAAMEVTSGVFSVRSGSVTIGDGSPSNRATAEFSGGSLSLLDAVSFVTVAAGNNTYVNANPYNANGTLVSTPGTVKGPASLTASGVSSSAILPVKLQSFTGKCNGTTVVLNWITAQEMNTAIFEVERSNDGISWTKIGSVSAKSNSIVASSYSFSEILKGAGFYSYRLKMIDIDNRFAYSPIVKISFNHTNGAFVKTYPNPATDFFAVDGADGSLRVMVVNINGAVVKVLNGYVANTKISLNGIVPGSYMVKVSDTSGSAQALKLIVAR